MKLLFTFRTVALAAVCFVSLPQYAPAGLVASLAKGPATKARAVAPQTPWERAASDRAQFEQGSQDLRTRVAYARVLDEFRAIYHDNPRDTHAAAAVEQVAELLAEEGDQFQDAKLQRAAIGQYDFLRKQYPASPLCAPALLAEARVAKAMGDEAGAREKFRAVMKEAPRSKAAVEARAELGKASSGSAQTAVAAPTHGEKPAMAGAQIVASVGSGAQSLPGSVVPARMGPAAQVSGIRHWSTPTYTRVAIDLGGEVTYQASRVPHPDRIFFDLHGTKLAQELVGKSFDVTDDGYLKRIRAAQAGPDVTRVVLDVSDVSEYSAFLLPNPYRLIIDIHGGRTAAKMPAELGIAADQNAAHQQPAGQDAADRDGEQLAPVTPAADRKASTAANRSGLPAMALTTEPAAAPAPAAETAWVTVPGAPAPKRAPVPAAATAARPGRPVPNTVAVKAPATTTEVAAVSDAPGRVDATATPTTRPIAAVVKARNSTPARQTTPAAAPTRAAQKTADGETSLVRALGLKINRIVIDAGHGGHDSGTLGVDGIQEKDVVLDVALRLGKLLHDRLGAEIIYTRSDDTFIPLETRTAIANKAQADLFLSIHANSSPDATARGVETYYLNFTSDATALDVAARENAVSGQSVHQLSDLVKKITLKDKIDESREFAADVEGALYAGLAKGNDGLHNRGVKKAPFVVLIGANMPSILAEISFVTNPRDAAQLRQPEYRERVAESLFSGVARYENGLAGAKPTAPLTRAAVSAGDHARP